MRCSKCLLPDSLPGSNFNAKNECSWCQTGFPHYEPKGSQPLIKFLNDNQSTQDSADCLVGLSGGKDSSYTLYKLVKEYGMKAEAFTYIHEGTTGFSVENAKNICRQLGVKHHIVSLKNEAHLKSFTDYYKAWTDNPTTISAGMTCVACKHLHLLGSQIAVKRNIPMIVWSSSPLEYSPFLAIKVEGSKDAPFKRKGMLSSSLLMLKQAAKSPKFTQGFIRNLHTSVMGCLAVFPTSAYLKWRYPSVKTLMFYDYENWNPKLIKAEISEKLNWRVPTDVREDWHSDCLFNVFKEYMFQKMLGVSYSDAFLSNQIRYGLMSREEAMQELLVSKKEFAKAIPDTLKKLGLSDLQNTIDYSCFNLEL